MVIQVYRNENMQKALLNGPYKNGALVPATPWLDNKAPKTPTVSVEKRTDSLQLTWSHPEPNDIFRWVVYSQYGNSWSYRILNRKDRTLNLPQSISSGSRKAELRAWSLSAIDRMGNESPKIETTLLN